MNDGPSSLLPSVVALVTVAGVALALTLTRGWATMDGSRPCRLKSAVRIAWITTVFQGVHFAEELATGFHERFPALFGLAPMGLSGFVAFNVGCLFLWLLCVRGLAARRRVALFPLWFLGLACAMNGVAHPAMAVRAGGYFPGLWTAPVAGVLGVLLVQRLLRVTQGSSSSGNRA